MGQFLSQCEASPAADLLGGLGGGGGPSSMNLAGLDDAKRNITNKFEEYKNISSKKVYAGQNVSVKQIPNPEGKFVDMNTPFYTMAMTNEYGIFGQRTKGPCANYGCGYNIDQSANIEMYTFNETIINESENIWSDIKMKLQQEATTQFEGNQSQLEAANEAFAGAEEEAIKNIEVILANMAETSLSKDQNIEIEYYTPVKCQNPCGESVGPTIKQDAQIIIKTEDIINSTLEIVQKRLADHEMDVTQETTQSNDACIAQIASCICCSLIILVILIIIKNKMDE